MMPPILAGLDDLSSSIQTLIQHFPVDTDALAVAAGLSQPGTPDRIPLAAALQTLSWPKCAPCCHEWPRVAGRA